MAWRGLASLFPTFALWAEFILATEAAYVLSANFPGPITTVVSQKLTNGNMHKTEGVSAGETSKFECTVTGNAKVRTHKFREMLTLILRPCSK